MRLIILIYLELGRFSKNGRSPIFRFYVSLFPISDSDPILTVAEIALGFCSQQRVPGSVCCHPAAFAAHHSVGGSARLITSACRYTDNSASTSDAADAVAVYGVEHVQWASACLLRWRRLWYVGGRIWRLESRLVDCPLLKLCVWCFIGPAR